MVLRDLFGREWARSPGEKVVRILWQGGPDGKQGREVEVVAGNDPDPTCVFYELLSNAIEHRYRFFEPLPQPAPGEPPGINLSNLEWWQYIGLNERHNLALTLRPRHPSRIARATQRKASYRDNLRNRNRERSWPKRRWLFERIRPVMQVR